MKCSKVTPSLRLNSREKVVGSESCRPSHLSQGERFTHVLADERDRTARAAILPGPRGTGDRVLDVGHDAAVGIDERHNRLGPLCLALHGGGIVEALLVERPRRKKRLGEPLEPRFEVGAHRLEPVSTVNENGLDVLVEPRRKEARARSDALGQLATQATKVARRTIGARLTVDDGHFRGECLFGRRESCLVA